LSSKGAGQVLASGRVAGSAVAAALRKTKRPQGQWVLRSGEKPLFFSGGQEKYHYG